ncbi:MAG: DUF1080 domain-containing protein [Acidobacteria bacterium]|nr:DUF1080 domain-containing protein [Acidobacteriota bacterium]
MTCQTDRCGLRGSGIFLLITAAILICCGVLAQSANPGRKLFVPVQVKSLNQNFDTVSVGKLPAGWTADATRLRGPMETWQVIEDSTAPSGSHVLGMTRPNHRFGGTFNICWTKSVVFFNGEISVHFKAVKGRGDQGGGIMWRVLNKNNYYVARFNPLEDNFCVYSVINGVRRILASATVKLPAGKWHTMKIVQKGNRFEGYLNGKKLISGTWSKINAAGGAGVWTKADAVTSFDDFSVRPAEQRKTKRVK